MDEFQRHPSIKADLLDTHQSTSLVQDETVDTHQTVSLSLSVVSYHSPPSTVSNLLSSLGVALQHLQSIFSKLNIHLFLVDNSEDSSFAFDPAVDLPASLAQFNIRVSQVRGHGNIGYGSAHNLAIRKATSEYHLILNPDVLLDADCLSQGLRYLKSNQAIAIVSPYAESANGSKQFLCKRYPSVLTLLVRAGLPKLFSPIFNRRLAHYEMQDLSEQHPSVDIPLLSGCFMLCRTSSLRAVDGFDEDYFMYFEDFDLSLRMAQTGKLAYLPSMKIRHFGGNASRKGIRHIIMFSKSAIRFFNRYRWRII